MLLCAPLFLVRPRGGPSTSRLLRPQTMFPGCLGTWVFALTILRGILRRGIAGIIVFKFGGGGIVEPFKNLMINKNLFQKKKKKLLQLFVIRFLEGGSQSPHEDALASGKESV